MDIVDITSSSKSLFLKPQFLLLTTELSLIVNILQRLTQYLNIL